MRRAEMGRRSALGAGQREGIKIANILRGVIAVTLYFRTYLYVNGRRGEAGFMLTRDGGKPKSKILRAVITIKLYFLVTYMERSKLY
jgi:hypothetical protein